MKLHEEIMELLRKKSKMEHDYVNPNFLVIINNALMNYYDLEDDGVDEWIADMWSS